MMRSSYDPVQPLPHFTYKKSKRHYYDICWQKKSDAAANLYNWTEKSFDQARQVIFTNNNLSTSTRTARI